MKNIRNNTPSEFYRLRRPEYFSDSEIIYDIELPKEQLAFELSQITTNQKQDEFENLCRKLAEKTICPNLIPQVGPTGGGDGKTDSETYPVSELISDRWFIPEQGWEKDEKWAFAFSAKSTWKSKAEGDIKKIIGTERDYTRVYFITNQTPSSKKKKDAQDEFIKKYKLDIVILDGTWILEKVYTNNLLDIIIDSLNLSNIFKNKQTLVGENDAIRLKKLNELEQNIQNPNRYFEFDFQLVEDALETAILSRKLEKPREEIEGKFDRAIRFCKKVNSKKQWIRIHYQRAWTYLYYYDDFSGFIEEYNAFKKIISEDSSISEIELYVNLFNSLRGACSANCNLADYNIEISEEKEELYLILDKFSNKEEKPCSSLIAKFYKVFEELMDSVSSDNNSDDLLKEISNYFSESKVFIDFPFESFKKMVEEIGSFFPTAKEYDKLIDTIASIDEKRSSELSAGQTFLKRAGQKFIAKQYKDSIVYFGKSVLKLAKEESNDGLYFALKGIGHAYNEMGLLWASNNCFISAISIAFKSWYEEGILDNRVYDCAKHMAINEQIIGRVPNFLAWHELFTVVSNQVESREEDNEIPTLELLDACLSVRFLNSDANQDNLFSFLPDILENNNLWLSQNAVLFKLGYSDLILGDYVKFDIKNEQELNSYFELIAGQPFRKQILYQTNFCEENEIEITSKVLGCSFIYSFEQDMELLLAAETLAAFFESFLATSLKDVFPNTEDIKIKLIRNNKENLFSFKAIDSSEYIFEIDKFSFSLEKREALWTKMLEFSSYILGTNFFINEPKELLERLFKDEEINERLSIIFEHRKFTINVLGDTPKLFYNSWKGNNRINTYLPKRKSPLVYNFSDEKNKDSTKTKPDSDLDNIRHNQRKVSSIIDVNQWDKAKWNAFGLFTDNNGLSIFIGYTYGEEGKKIFKDWIKKFGVKDTDEKIKITIIKGVDKHNPYWYRVHIGANVKKEELKSGDIILSASRFHEMNATTPNNLNKLISVFNDYKSFRFCPAEVELNANKINPFEEYSIIKHEITFRNAWEIGLHDLENVAIKKGDNPIIPKDVKNAPVLEVLRRKENGNC
ncbi:MAG: hypothetical protein N4A49_06255 [Marinifilaceae bacterium]|jgi:hypothetical protein|nr:hypothetical protein [Marinifilaceae bacterium]